jgi:hypothetical protein
VEIDPSLVRAVVLGTPSPRDRNEEEVRGYRDALRLIHSSSAQLEVSEATIRELHRISRGGVGDAGEYKRHDVDIIETTPDGRSRVRFKTVPARSTPKAMRGLIAEGNSLAGQTVPSLIAVAALNLDFLCVHLFRDGNGRVSRSETAARRGEKRETVIAIVERTTAPFSVAELRRDCPGVSVDMIRHVLNDLRKEGRVECLGRGPAARWRRVRAIR